MSFRGKRGSYDRLDEDSIDLGEALLPVDTVHKMNEEYNAFTPTGIASVVVGILVGGILCFSNTYFGLQSGWVTMGSLQSTLLGFGLFRAMSCGGTTNLFSKFGPLDNVLLQTTAVATATMPLAGGFVGILPALAKLDEKIDKHGPITTNLWQNLLWAFALCYFGVFFAVPLRRQTILKEKLKFPSGTATAQMIRVLHKQPPITEDEDLAEKVEDRRSLLFHDELAAQTGEPVDVLKYNDEEKDRILWRHRWIALGSSFLSSGILTLLCFFITPLQDMKIGTWIGLPVLTTWNWTFRTSLSYIGQGMIMGIHTSGSMLAGAIVGWAILGPVSLSKGWTKFLTADEMKNATPEEMASTPSQWLLWIALSIMLVEAVVGLLIMVVKVGISLIQKKNEKVHDPALPSQSVPHWVWIVGLIVSCALCVGIVTPLFDIPFYDPLIAVVMSLLVCILAVRALGETDYNPVSGVGKIAQIVLAFVSPGQSVSCLVAGAIAEAGATQAGDLMQDLKTGHLLGASPRAMLIAQSIGSIFGVLFSSLAYALYSSLGNYDATYKIGGSQFPAPTADIWLNMSRVLMNKSLPHSVIPFCIGFGVLGGVLPLIETLTPKKYEKYLHYLPSGMAFAIGVFLTPNFTFIRFLGSIAQVLWARFAPTSHTNHMIVVASGFVLGEGIFSLLTAGFTAAHVPRWGGVTASSGGGH